jgi:hypothetical protein
MIIKVEQKHINEGQARKCKECPVALAMTKQIGIPIRVGSISWYPDDNERHGYRLPNFVKDKILLFDQDRYVAPFEFEISDKEIQDAKQRIRIFNRSA